MSAHRILLALLLSLSVLAGCPPSNPPPPPDGGTPSAAPEVTSVTPTSGPSSGGTSVTLRGTGFQPGAKVFFGELQATSVGVISRTQLTATTPALEGGGPVDVKVQNTDGKSHVVAQAFRYDTAAVPKILEARLANDASKRDGSGNATVAVLVTADVEVSGITQGTGEGAGVIAQVGFHPAPVDLSNLSGTTWTAATYQSDVDGATAGDKQRDRYQARVDLPGATGVDERIYVLLSRFSIDGGTTWVLGDRDGAANGTSVPQLAQVILTRPTVDWCKLGGDGVTPPPNIQLKTNQAGPKLYGQVYRNNVTNAAGAGLGIVGQLGYGPVGTAPSTSEWVWTNATYNKDLGNNDEYETVLPNPGEGAYALAYRFALSGGPYLYCDADGSDAPGFTSDQAGTLTVTALNPSEPSCHVPTLSPAAVGSGAKIAILGRIHIQGVTEVAGPGANVTGEVGIGPAGTNPASTPGWTWKPAAFAKDVAGAGEDEFAADLGPAYTGHRGIAYRFRQDTAAWTYCDSTPGSYELDEQPILTVNPHEDFDYCVLQWPTELNNRTEVIYGRVYEKNLTEAAGAGAGIVAELGYGQRGEDPGVAWTWVPATFHAQRGNNDEFKATLDMSLPAGTYDYAFRFSKSPDGAYCYGDLDGHYPAQGMSPANGFSGTQSNLGKAVLP